MAFHNDRLQEPCDKESRLAAVQEMSLLSSQEKTYLLGVHSGQTQKPTSHPVVSALKIRKRALLELFHGSHIFFCYSTTVYLTYILHEFVTN